jgi:hypothetical protein
MPSELKIVCINVGDKYGDEYVQRLYNMCARNLSEPFQFILYRDRPHDLSPEIEQRDCSEWGVPGWFNKIKLFDRAVLNEDFLFLDVSQVIKSSLDPLLAFARAHPEKRLFGMRDWNYDCFGSPVMYVRPSETTQSIWNTYASGVRFPTKTAIDGDQDFIDSCIETSGMEPFVGYFPQEWFASYKLLRKAHAGSRAKATKMLADAMFVKFHGPPKMHTLLNPWKNLVLTLRKKPFRVFHYWRYLATETREWWR